MSSLDSSGRPPTHERTHRVVHAREEALDAGRGWRPSRQRCWASCLGRRPVRLGGEFGTVRRQCALLMKESTDGDCHPATTQAKYDKMWRIIVLAVCKENFEGPQSGFAVPRCPSMIVTSCQLSEDVKASSVVVTLPSSAFNIVPGGSRRAASGLGILASRPWQRGTTGQHYTPKNGKSHRPRRCLSRFPQKNAERLLCGAVSKGLGADWARHSEDGELL